MRIKKRYTKPILETSFIDNEISLIMMTDEETPPDKPTFSVSSASSTTSTTTGGGETLKLGSFDSTPFE